MDPSRSLVEFRLLTNHGNALILIARDPRIRLRDIGAALDITERRAQRIVSDLIAAGYLAREREGRRNFYHVALHLPLRLPLQEDLDLGSLLAILPPA
jgi:DNA-binding MarR family transcriptional regulator